MNCRTYIHQPAMNPQEAALLPALPPNYPTMPLRQEDFRPAAWDEAETPRPRSAAGRAVLHARGVWLPGLARRR